MYRRKISFLLRVNSFKQRSESWIRCCFCSNVSQRGTHLEYNFFILKFSCTTFNPVPFDIFRMSAISCNFTFRSNEMIFRIFSCVFGRSRLSWTTWALRVFGVCSTAFKICIPSISRQWLSQMSCNFYTYLLKVGTIENKSGMALAASSMCQSRDLMTHVLIGLGFIILSHIKYTQDAPRRGSKSDFTSLLFLFLFLNIFFCFFVFIFILNRKLTRTSSLISCLF